MLLITGLIAYALYQHIDGAILSIAIAIIAGLGGYEAKKLIKKK